MITFRRWFSVRSGVAGAQAHLQHRRHNKHRALCTPLYSGARIRLSKSDTMQLASSARMARTQVARATGRPALLPARGLVRARVAAIEPPAASIPLRTDERGFVVKEVRVPLQYGSPQFQPGALKSAAERSETFYTVLQVRGMRAMP